MDRSTALGRLPSYTTHVHHMRLTPLEVPATSLSTVYSTKRQTTTRHLLLTIKYATVYIGTSKHSIIIIVDIAMYLHCFADIYSLVF